MVVDDRCRVLRMALRMAFSHLLWEPRSHTSMKPPPFLSFHSHLYNCREPLQTHESPSKHGRAPTCLRRRCNCVIACWKTAEHWHPLGRFPNHEPRSPSKTSKKLPLSAWNSHIFVVPPQFHPENPYLFLFSIMNHTSWWFFIPKICPAAHVIPEPCHHHILQVFWGPHPQPQPVPVKLAPNTATGGATKNDLLCPKPNAINQAISLLWWVIHLYHNPSPDGRLMIGCTTWMECPSKTSIEALSFQPERMRTHAAMTLSACSARSIDANWPQILHGDWNLKLTNSLATNPQKLGFI